MDTLTRPQRDVLMEVISSLATDVHDQMPVRGHAASASLLLHIRAVDTGGQAVELDEAHLVVAHALGYSPDQAGDGMDAAAYLTHVEGVLGVPHGLMIDQMRAYAREHLDRDHRPLGEPQDAKKLVDRIESARRT